jgi:hypothetical protein
MRKFDGIALVCLAGMTLSAADPAPDKSQLSRVENHTFISPDNPNIRVEVDRKLDYVGNVPFIIGDAVQGTRYVFVRATRDKRIQRMFIIQQEGFLATSTDTYKYSITTPAKLGNSDYRHSVIMDDNDARIREEPGKEADLTQRFLALHKYVLEPEVVMSRFARPADAQRKHEIIFFCYENLSSYGHKLTDFAEGSNSAGKQRIAQKVDENCRNSFRVNN